MTASNDAKSPGQGSSALRLAGRIANTFIASKLTPLVIVAALLLGAFSILQTPAGRRAADRRARCWTYLCRCRALRPTKSHNASVFPWSACCEKYRELNTYIPSAIPA